MFQSISLSTAAQVLGRDFPSQIGTRATHGRWLPVAACPLSEENRRMVMVARNAGASAKFAGSGGAIVGTYEDDSHFERLSAALSEIGCRTLKPAIVENDDADMLGDGVWRNS